LLSLKRAFSISYFKKFLTMKKLFVLASFLGFALAANAQCSGAKAASTTDAAPAKACCAGKKACNKTADAAAKPANATATAVGMQVVSEMPTEAAPKKACTGSAEGKKCCAKKTAEAEKVETTKPTSGTN
jgi:hypothetical protein